MSMSRVLSSLHVCMHQIGRMMICRVAIFHDPIREGGDEETIRETPEQLHLIS